MIIVKAAHRAQAVPHEGVPWICHYGGPSRKHVLFYTRIKRILTGVTDVSDIDVTVFSRVRIHQMIGNKCFELMAVGPCAVLLIVRFRIDAHLHHHAGDGPIGPIDGSPWIVVILQLTGITPVVDMVVPHQVPFIGE